MKKLLSTGLALFVGATLVAGCTESPTDQVGERPGGRTPSASPPTRTPPPSSSTPSTSPSTGSPSSQPSTGSGTK